MSKLNRQEVEVNAGSMADIAFLLLIFFLVTTTIILDKGLMIKLPPKLDETLSPPKEVAAENLFKVLINSQNQLLVEDAPMQVEKLRKELKAFLLDRIEANKMDKATVAIRTDRGTSYKNYLQILDEVKGAYHELRAAYMGISLYEYLSLEPQKMSAELLELYEKAEKQYPMRISEAEPHSSKN